MEFLLAVFEIVKNVWDPFTKQLNYLKSLPGNMEILRSKTEELSNRENDIKIELHRAEVKQGKKRKRDVDTWIKNVQMITNEVGKIGEEVGEEKRFLPRLRLGKIVSKKIEEVAELQEIGRFSDGLMVDEMPESGNTLPTGRLVGKRTAGTLEMIWDCLMDVNTGIIGVHGMGGVGKTTIMKHINNRLKKTQLFDNIIWVTVSKALNLVRFQGDIAKAIDLNLLEDDYEQNRSAKLYAALRRRKRFLLILDDIWEAFPLEEVGIPEPGEDNGCKLVFITRDLGVCRAMETQRDIRVELLSAEEAWELFKDKVGGDVMLSSNVHDIAKQVAKECACLPLAIITVGRALRQVTDVRVWRNALNELKQSTTEIKGMEDVVFARLKFSYNRLRNDNIRACFLYCALYPEDYEIPTWELKEYWICEGLVPDVKNRESELDKGQTILNELQYACMLESVVNEYNIECVKMHDLIRDMAIDITRATHQLMVKASVGLKEFPEGEQWDKNLERVSLMRNDIKLITGSPECPKLCTLFLQVNPLEDVTHSFFDQMHNLKVLDLSFTSIKFLPDSLSELENLSALLLRYCKISKVPSLTKMKALKVLSLHHTRIEELPEGISRLANLRLLDISYTRHLKLFPAGLLPRLPFLENFLMYRSRYRWPLCSSSVEAGAGIEDLMNSASVTTLHIHFLDLPAFDTYMRSQRWRMLKGYRFSIGQVSCHLPSAAFEWNSCSVEVVGCHLCSSKNSFMLPENTLNLDVDDCNDFSRLSELPCLAALMQLRECYLGKCKGMECVLVAEENSLSTVEKLILSDLPHLSTLCKGIVLHDTLRKLKILHIDTCNNLKSLFSLFLFSQLRNLEEIVIEGCKVMEEIVSGEGDMGRTCDNTITLQSLKKLELYQLPELKKICQSILICSSLHSITIWNCPKLKKLPIYVSSLMLSLKEIRGSHKWWNELEWDNRYAKARLQPYFKEM